MERGKLHLITVLMMAFILMAVSVPALGEISMEAEVGYNGVILNGRWFPVEVRVTGGEQAFEGEISVACMQSTTEYDRFVYPVSVEARETKTVRFPISTLIPQLTFTVELTENGTAVAAVKAVAQRAISDDTLLAGVLGGGNAVAQDTQLSAQSDMLNRKIVLSVLSLDSGIERLGDKELDAFQMIVVCGDRTTLLSEAENERLTRWEGRGGILRFEEAGTEVQTDSGEYWQALLQTADQEALSQAMNGDHRKNYLYGSTLNERQWVGEGERLFPVFALLALYVCICSGVLFVLLRYFDRTGALWYALPASAVAGLLLVVFASNALELNAPAAASFRVTHYDAQGRMVTQERALVAYADEGNAMITAEPSAQIERMEYGYFYSGAEKAKRTVLRDTLYLGEDKGIMLSEVAPWKARNLVIKPPIEPKGSVTGIACMEEDGLHVHVINDTDTALYGALIFTPLGYAQAGDIPAGADKEIVIERAQTVVKRKDGSEAILEGTLLEYPVSLYSVTEASVFPWEQTDPAWKSSQLSEEERYPLDVESSKRRLSVQLMGNAEMSCVLYANTSDLPCVQLFVNGKAVTQTAQESLLSAHIPFSVRSKTGDVYCPKGMFEPHTAQAIRGKPEMGEVVSENWYRDMSEDLYFGFDLSSLSSVEIRSIKVLSNAYGAEDAPLSVEIYDNTLEDFVKMPMPGNCVLENDLIRRAVNAEGQVFIRYTVDSEHGGSLSAPQVIVEGVEVEDTAQAGEAGREVTESEPEGSVQL